MTSEFQVALAACCALHKANSIPEVEAVKRLIEPLVRARLEGIAENLLREWLARLGRFPIGDVDRQKREVIDALLTALLDDGENVYALPFDFETRQAVREAVDALLGAGGAATGALDLGSPLLPIQAAAAERELVLLVQEAVVGRFGDVRGLLGQFLTNEATRVGQGLLGAASVFDQQLLATLAPSGAVSAAIDTWAYGTFNAGIVAASDLRGVEGYRLKATIDGRETSFCRWANGRFIPLRRVLRQQEALQQAALSGDIEAIKRARPFLSSEVARRGNELQFERFLRRAGLPPFHFGCRTQARPDRE